MDNSLVLQLKGSDGVVHNCNTVEMVVFTSDACVKHPQIYYSVEGIEYGNPLHFILLVTDDYGKALKLYLDYKRLFDSCKPEYLEVVQS